MNKGIGNHRLSKQEQYWKELHLSDVDKTTVGHDFFSDQYKKQNISFPIKNEVIDKLKAVTKENDLLTYVVFLTALNIELYKYTGNDEIVVGVPVYFSDKKRPLSIKNKVLPFKSTINGTLNVKSFLMDTQKKLLDAYENQYVDLLPAFRKLNMSCTIAELTPVSITYNSLHLEEDIEYICNSHQNEITICIDKNDAEDVEIGLVFNASLYKEEAVKQFAERFIQVLNEILSDFNSPIKDVGLLTETQKNHILNDFNDTSVVYKDLNKPFHELFESQAERTPDQIALIFEDNEVTYKELNDKSNAFARKLRNKGVQPEDIVGVMLERSIEMVAGILGILKSGAAYLPIDPKNPKNRIEYMLHDAQAKVLLSNPRLTSDIEFTGTLIDAGESRTFEGDVNRLDRVNKPNDLAYVIYTSGTTGNPKGVMVEHHSLTQTMLFLKDDYQYSKNHVVLPIINYAFDGFVLLFYTPLISGSKVILVNNEEMVSPYKISELMKTRGVTNYFSVPSIYLTVLDYLSEEESISLRQVTLVGEELPVKAIEYTNRLNQDIEIVNRYGPSENTVETTTMRHVERNDKILIGKPIANSKVYIVDEDHNILPIGVPGEICIGGSRLARGYLNKPELTKEKFIENPFEKGQRMYKTGDRGKWLDDGSIEFLGRKDNQVKIRGQRIELKEIEDRLLRHPDVKEAVVYAEKNAELDQYIMAYVVGSTAIISDIKNYLKESLPHYMVPSYIMLLEKMPLTNNGKIDFRSLPKPDVNESVNSYVAPRNNIEKELAILWQEILAVDKVGIDDNFFDLGGHSLKANVFISKLHKNVNVELPIKDLFMNPTIRAISSVVIERREKSYEMIPICKENEYYETSAAQKRMYMIQQLENGTAYNMPSLFEVKGEVDYGRIEETFQKLVNRHDPLRTFFDDVNGEIVQKIYPDQPFTMERRDRRGWMVEALAKDFVRPFELNKAPLFRVEIAELEETTYLMVDMHHIISDGVSIERLFSEFLKLYSGEELEPLRIQYKDFAAWQNGFLKSDELKKQEDYWIQQFTGDIPVLNLPYDFERPLMQSFEGEHLSFSLNEGLTEGLRGIAKKTGTTMHMVLISAFYILLSKYSGQEDIVVGTPVAGRPHADLQNIMGMFVNNLALRNKAEGRKSFLEFLEEVKQNSLLAYENQSYQFEDLIDKLEVNRDTSRHPLFNVMFNMSHAIQEAEREYKGLHLEQIQRESHISKFDLTLHITEQESTINGNIEYCTRLFKKETVERMVLHFNEIVTSICQNNEAKLHQINMMTESEKQQILHEFNKTKTNYPREKTIVELFEEQAEKRPGHKAVIFETQHITYKDLNQKADQLAAALRKKGVHSGTVVAIMIESSIEMVIGILGILKAGGAYLPIDKSYPTERIHYMLRDSNAQVLLSTGSDQESIDFSGERLDVEDERLYQGDISSVRCGGSPLDLAYIMYSSGSTGKPKGILVEHRNVVRLVKNNEFIQFEENDAILQTGSLVFDATTFEMWGALLNGLSLYLVNREIILSADALEKEISSQSISIMWLTVALFNQLAQEKPAMFRKLRYLIVGGDALSAKHINLVKRNCNNIKILNGYGPTENTTFSTTFQIDKEYEAAIPIGKPISNSSAYIVDSHGELLPVGIYGELYLGGDGVARGYLNQPELTSEKFIQNPFVPGEKLYKSGDIARWQNDGNIEFAGRADHQVKIRGFRIEIEEIERRLLSHPSIKEAMVLAKENEQNEKYLCAYVTLDKVIDKSILKDYLKEKLPDYMVPAYMLEVESFPLTTNGKIDKKSLPEATHLDLIHGDYAAPRTKTEEQLVAIWNEVLSVGEIGIDDNFFELGGNSLKASLMVNKIHKEMNKIMPLRTFFENASIRTISRYIDNSMNKTYKKIEAAGHKDYYKVSSVQKRMYTLQQIDHKSTTYNIPTVFELGGLIDKARIEKTFRKLIERHEALRTSFKTVNGEIVQAIQSEYTFSIGERKEDSKTIEEIMSDFIRYFKLEESPLCRVELVEIAEKKYLLIDMHHIITDGLSMTILMKDFVQLYNGYDMAPLRIQYKDYSEWQHKFLQSEVLKEYWINKFTGELPVLNLPYDFDRPAIQNYDGKNISFSLDEKTTEVLRRISRQTESSMFMVLLSAFYILLAKYSSQEDIVVGTPAAGRTHPDLESILGMFVNTLALRNKPSGSKSFIHFLKEVRENSLEAFEKQSYQYEELLDEVNVEKDMSRNPLFDVMFTYTDKEKDSGLNLELDGLSLKSINVDSTVSKFDLSLNMAEKEKIIECHFEYCTKLFQDQTVRRMVDHFNQILKRISENYDVEISEIEITSTDEKDLILHQFNNTDAAYPKDKTIHQLVEEQAARIPDHTAVVFADKRLTYRELNERANQLAWVLRE
ncbi:amino acid adenylation domain-containing protein, partial [Rossellomorea sp. BNER]|uniref:amino acid adenylation domain-containing protein n=1 Tax=Rossellomorea sp. BNER TaxID=2962031 RepID=UPI003AF2836C|nr:amino acid adenylation domain-containing protein [Rossellomorea sp. BNER]